MQDDQQADTMQLLRSTARACCIVLLQATSGAADGQQRIVISELLRGPEFQAAASCARSATQQHFWRHLPLRCGLERDCWL